MRAYGVFEGGGAAGIAHLGAYAAIRKLKIDLLGVAGASAASLIAAGYEADELFDPRGNQFSLLERYDVHRGIPREQRGDPINLLGHDLWADWTEAAAWVQAGHAKRVLLFGLAGYWTWNGAFRRVLRRVRENGGYFSTDGVRNFVNWALRERLLDLAPSSFTPAGKVPEDVSFADLSPRNFPRQLGAAQAETLPLPLRIVAADIDTKEALIFGPTSNETVPVADAVAASIAIPVFFQPKRLRLGNGTEIRAVDGGLVSNLPVWLHAEDKLLYERANPGDPPPIIAFSIRSERPTDAPPSEGLADLLDRVLRTGIFGGQTLARLHGPEATIITVTTTIPVSGFDAGLSAIVATHDDARRCVEHVLPARLIALPRLFRQELERIRREAALFIPGELPADCVRANVLFPYRGHSLRVTYGVGMEDHADDRLLVDLRTRGAAFAFRENKITIVQLTAPDGGPSYMTKYEIAMLRPGLDTIASAPIPQAGGAGVLGVLSIDFKHDVSQYTRESQFTQWLASQAAGLSGLAQQEHENG